MFDLIWKCGLRQYLYKRNLNTIKQQDSFTDLPLNPVRSAKLCSTYITFVMDTDIDIYCFNRTEAEIKYIVARTLR